jgi:SPP1 family predicted phage head-tail adaptor
MTGAGQRNRRLIFRAPTAVSDGAGNFTSGWTNRFTVWARVQPRAGGETVQAERLSGRQPYTIIVLQSTDTLQITTGWSAVDAHDATKVFNIRTIANMDERNYELEMLAETGVAT